MNTDTGGPSAAPELMTPREVATMLRVDRRTVYTWIRSGGLPSMKVGKLWRIPREYVRPKMLTKR